MFAGFFIGFATGFAVAIGLVAKLRKKGSRK